MTDVRKENWFSGSGSPANFSSILKDIESVYKKNDNFEIHVGTDSDPSGKKCTVATGIAIRFPGNGCRYYWTRSRMTPEVHKNLGMRLEAEALQSIIVADHLRDFFKNKIKIVIHIDCSDNPKNGSEKYAKRLKSYAAGMGFEVRIKPNSWAASSLADKHAKNFGLLDCLRN